MSASSSAASTVSPTSSSSTQKRMVCGAYWMADSPSSCARSVSIDAWTAGASAARHSLVASAATAAASATGAPRVPAPRSGVAMRRVGGPRENAFV